MLQKLRGIFSGFFEVTRMMLNPNLWTPEMKAIAAAISINSHDADAKTLARAISEELLNQGFLKDDRKSGAEKFIAYVIEKHEKAVQSGLVCGPGLSAVIHDRLSANGFFK